MKRLSPQLQKKAALDKSSLVLATASVHVHSALHQTHIIAAEFFPIIVDIISILVMSYYSQNYSGIMRAPLYMIY